jgi:choline dehydrogenase-like flavoprotein
MTDRFDVIIIGTGAGGGTLAHTLAPTGKKILLLERGDFLPREMANWDPGAVFADGRYISPDTWHDSAGKPFQPQVHYFVGGATKMYGAALYRLRPADFGEIKYSDGVSTAWPLSYDDLEPYYTRAEWLYQVHGDHGEDPTEGSASKQYPWPAVSHESRVQRISDDLAAAGYHPFHAPCGILLDETRRPASTCIRCAWCDGYPCLVHAKADAETIAVRPLLGQPNITLLTGAEVTTLRTDSTGRVVTEVVVSRDGSGGRGGSGLFRVGVGGGGGGGGRGGGGGGGGHEERYAADIVVLAAGAANSARILLNSASDQHPNGLANGSDQVGRNFMFHNSKAVAALAKEPNDTVYQKTLAINDFYLADGDRAPLGNIQMLGKSNGAAMKGEEPKLTKLAPKWGLDLVARHCVDFWLTTEDLPLPENRVTVDRAGKIHLAYTFTNEAETAGLYEEFKTILNKTGLASHHVLSKNFYMDMEVPIAGVAHQAGTMRFGKEKSLSVSDVNCKAHELDNLYFADASIFPSIGAVNPALTVMANAIRVGDLLATRLG